MKVTSERDKQIKNDTRPGEDANSRHNQELIVFE